VVVTAYDEFNNVATGYTGTIAFTSSDGQAVLPTTGLTFAEGDNGTKTFAGGVTLKTAGEQTVTATDTTTASITGSQTGITVNAAAASKMTLEASKTTIASDQKGSATLTATILDDFGNVIESDNSTVVGFALASGAYLTLSSATDTASSGVATVTVTSKAGKVADPPATDSVSITATGLTSPSPLPLTIVNFSIDVTSPSPPFYDVSTGVHLVTSGSTPYQATFIGLGSTTGDYRWALTGVGEIDSTTADSITYTAPSSIEGDSQTATLTLTSATDEALTDSITITIYSPIAVTSPTEATGITLGDTTHGVTVTGGSGTYKFQSTDTAVATVNADTGAVTPVAVGTCQIQVRDATYGVFGTENGFYAISQQIEIVNPITVSPATKSLDASGTQTFTASGGKGNYTWTSSNPSAGSIDKTTGVFTAAAVTTTQTAIITATDGTYTDITGTATVTVYPAMVISQTPSGYVDGTPSTYPLLTLGTPTTLTAADSARSYDWTVVDWEGTEVDTQTTGAATYVLNPDTLFAAHGAGIYTVTLTDKDNTDLKATTLKVRVPMKFVATKFAGAATKDAGTYKTDTDASDTYTITGGPAGDVYSYAAVDLNGAASTAGTFDDASPTDNDNVFTFASGIDTLTSYRVKVTLDSTSEDTDVKRLIDAGLGTLWSGIFRVVRVVSYSGTVVEADGTTPVAGATVQSLYDTTKTATTDQDGKFTLSGFAETGATYKFAISKSGYVDKIATGEDIEAGRIMLEALATGSGSISGTVTLNDGATPNGIAIKVKADGEYVKDSSGNVVRVFANSTTGAYTFPVPASYTAATSLTVEARKIGYIFDETAGLGVLTNVTLAGDPPVATNANMTLYPSTVIAVSGTAVDSDADGTYDQVLVKITAKAGAAPAQFDGTAGEIRVLDADGNDLTSSLDVFETEGANTWSFTHEKYENFSITVYADVSEDRDVDAGYKATKKWSYVKSATATTEKRVSDPNITGGTADSPNANVNLPPGGLTGDVLDSVTIWIVEVSPADAGATQITASQIVDIVLTDPSGSEVSNNDLQRIEITLKFDPTVVTQGTLENETYVIHQAASMEDMLAGNETPVPVSHIILPIDYVNGYVTFWVDHLSVFGVGTPPSPSVPAPSGGGDNCFIATAAYGSLFEPHVKILRQFRDEYLVDNALGQAFVNAYYRYSPPIAAFIAKHESAKMAVRVGLAPLVGVSYLAMNTSAAQKALILIFMLSLVSGMVIVLRIRRRIV